MKAIDSKSSEEHIIDDVIGQFVLYDTLVLTGNQNTDIVPPNLPLQPQ